MSEKLTVDEFHHKERLDVYLTQHMEDTPSRTFVKKLIDGGHVRVNGKTVKAHYKITQGETISFEVPADLIKPTDIAPENIPLSILYEDDYLLVINKPVGMLVHPTTNIFNGTLVNALLHHCKTLSDVNTGMRPGIVHRLDQETSGVIIVAKDNKTHRKIAKQFERHTVRKKYLAIVEGAVEFDEGMVDAPLGKHSFHHERRSVDFSDVGKESITLYRVLKRAPGISYMALYPQTGRTHQLRVHMRHIGHPILGDDKYGRKDTFSRLALHAQSVGFIHPGTTHFVEFSCKTPPEFLERLKA